MLFFFLASIGISMIQAFVTCATNESGSSSHSSSSSSRPGGKDDDTADKVRERVMSSRPKRHRDIDGKSTEIGRQR